MEASHWRRNDVARVTVEYTNGQVDDYVVGHNSNAVLVKASVNNSTEKRPRDRREWDEVEVFVKSPERALRQDNG
jgi:hypothetical protein